MSPRAGGPRRMTPLGRPTRRAAHPGPGREQRGQRDRRLGPRHGDAPGSGARRPGSSDTAAARPRRKPPPLSGCRPPAAASVVPAAARLRECPRAQASQPISEKPCPRLRPSGRVPGGRRSPLRAASRSRPPAPSSPRSPSCHTRPGSAGIRPTPAGAPRAGRAPGAERGGAAGPGGGPGRGGGGAAGSAEAWEGCVVPSFGGARDWRPCLPGQRGPGGSNSAPRGRGFPRKPAERWSPLPPTFPSGVSYVFFFFFPQLRSLLLGS